MMQGHITINNAPFSHERYTKEIRKKLIRAGEGKGPPVPVPTHQQIKARRLALDISQDELTKASGTSASAVQSCDNGGRCSAEMRVWFMQTMDALVWNEHRGCYLRPIGSRFMEVYKRVRLSSGAWGRHVTKASKAALAARDALNADG